MWTTIQRPYEGTRASLCSTKLPVPSREPDDSPDAEKAHEGIAVGFIDGVTDEEHRERRAQWRTALDKRPFPTACYPNKPEPPCALHEDRMYDPFAEEHLTKVHVECTTMNFNFGNSLEPMFCAAFLVDGNRRRRLSEVWNFNLMDDQLLELVNASKTASSLRATSALFHVPLDVVEHVFLVFQVGIVLGGNEVATAAEPYMKENLKAKDRDKFLQDVQARCRMLGQFQQKFGFSFTPLVENHGDFEIRGKRRLPLFKYRSDLTEKDLYDQIEQTYYQKGRRTYPKQVDGAQPTNRGGLLGLFQKNTVPCELTFRFASLLETPPNSLSPALLALKPVKEGAKTVREIQPFLDVVDFHTPALDYANVLYFYPEMLNFNRHPSASSRNIAIRVKVLPSQEDPRAPGLPIIYGRSTGDPLQREMWASVTYHSTKPSFCNEEFKIQLPSALSHNLHLVVEFFHVKCNLVAKKKGKEKDKEDIMHELGFAAIPIVDRSGELLDDQTDSAPVILTYEKDYMNPPEEAAFQYVDQGKKIFSYRTFVWSTLQCKEPHIRKFFKSMSLGTEGGGAHLRQSIKGLEKASPEWLSRFLPVIFHHLLRIICEEKEEYACLALLSLASIAETLCVHGSYNDASQHPTFRSLVLFMINRRDVESKAPPAMVAGAEPEEPGYVKGMHFKILRTWQAIIRRIREEDSALLLQSTPPAPGLASPAASGERTSGSSSTASGSGSGGNVSASGGSGTEPPGIPVAQAAAQSASRSALLMADPPPQAVVNEGTKEGLDLVHRHSWMFLNLILKSICLTVEGEEGGLSKTPRKERVGSEFMKELLEVILELSVVSFSRLNYNVAFFLRDLLYVLDRGYVMRAISDYVVALDSSYSSVKLGAFKFLTLEVILDFEDLVPLSYPCLPKSWTASDTPDVSTLVRMFWRQHRLVGLFLHEVHRYLESSDREARVLAGKSLFNFLWRVEHDPRYAGPEHQRAIANTFFPLVLIVMEVWERKAEEMDTDEKRTLLMSVLYVLRHCSKSELLAKWLQNDTRVSRIAFLELLKELISTMEKSNVVTEASWVVNLVLDHFMDDMQDQMHAEDSVVLRRCVEVLDTMYEKPQTASFLGESFHTVRWLMHKFKKSLFNQKDTSHCGTLSYHILRFSNARNGVTRMEAAALFASLLMLNYECRQNIARMKLQSTIAISRLAEADTTSYDSLREVLQAVGSTLEARSGDVGKRFGLLHKTLKSVIGDSERIAVYRFDAEMTEDLYYDVSLAYVDSPDLRVTWLDNLAKHHTQRKNFDEAAQCRVFMAALIIEHLNHDEEFRGRGLPLEAQDFEEVSPTIVDQPRLPEITAAQALEEGIYQSDFFSGNGLVRTLKEAIRLFACGGSFELGIILNELCFVQHYCYLRHYQNLGNTFRQMETMAKQLAMSVDARFFGYFYRVLFVGKGWGELHGKEYIYKEQNHVSFVNIIKQRLEKQFAEKYDVTKIKILPNSFQLHTEELIEEAYGKGTLERDMMYWQLVSVKEYLSDDEAKERHSQWERRFNLKRFYYETPFTKGNKGDQTETVEHQWKRKQVVTTQRAFPSAQKRCRVVSREIMDMTPIENAIDLLAEKEQVIRDLLSANDPENKLQFFHRELQGAVLPMVNAGPLAIAKTFLGEYQKYEKEHVRRLRIIMKDFSKVIYFAIKVYQRCAHKKDETEQVEQAQGGEGTRPGAEGGDLDFVTVILEEYEKFKTMIDMLVKNSSSVEE
mmetsp:Transcript_5025/g.14107  ORF Transcript_5025/g.14107 Transcript_5025/m.14107 type:complete len:1732 (-) Transcript_5025:41-5236(-)